MQMNRNLGIGGSDAAAACGHSRFKSRHKLWEQKMGIEDDKVWNEKAIEMGNELEPVLISRYAKTTAKKNNWSVVYFASNEDQRRYPFPENVLVLPQTTFFHAEDKFRYAHPDGFIVDRGTRKLIGLIEAKTSGQFHLDEWGENDDDVPVEYFIQGCHTLDVVQSGIAEFCKETRIDNGGINFVHFPALIGREELLRHISPEQDTITAIRALEREFWAMVENKTEPPYDDPAEHSQILKSKYVSSGASIPATPEIVERVLTYSGLRKQSDELEKQILVIKNELQEFMGNNSILVGPNFSITWKSSDRKTVDWDAVVIQAGVMPEIVAKNTTVKSVRTFLGPKFK